jgi:hypothetical protein
MIITIFAQAAGHHINAIRIIATANKERQKQSFIVNISFRRNFSHYKNKKNKYQI